MLASIDTNLPPRVRHRRAPIKSTSEDAQPPAPIPKLKGGLDVPTITPKAPTTERPSIKAELRPKSLGVNTLRRFQLAHQDTPEKLRNLEEGWRARRRISLSPEEPAKAPAPDKAIFPLDTPSVPAPPLGLLPERADRKSAATRRRVSFASLPGPPILTGDSPRDIHALSKLPPLHQDPALPRLPTRAQGSERGCKIDDPRTATLISPQPILASPLPCSSSPQSITSRSTETILVPDPTRTDTYELQLRLEHRTISVSKGGKELSIRRNAASSTTSASRPKDHVLRLVDQSRWSKKDMDEWRAIEKLVHGFKRKTPRLKIFHAVGNICATCSSPPDIILSFSTSSNPQEKDTSITKVRITYSRLAGDIRIDTLSARGKERDESLRTRRIIKLHPSKDQPLELKEPGGTGHEVKQAMDGLGIRSTSGWRTEELEAVRRIWLSRGDWLAFS